MKRLKRFAQFMEQDGGLPTSAPTNITGADRIAGTGSDIPPVSPNNRFNLLKRKTAKLINNKVIENTDLERK